MKNEGRANKKTPAGWPGFSSKRLDQALAGTPPVIGRCHMVLMGHKLPRGRRGASEKLGAAKARRADRGTMALTR
jgi:hypothetical protein